MTMRRLVEADGQGFEAILEEPITLFCGIYIYTGVLVGVHDEYLELSQPQLVYETGPLDAGEWKDAESLPTPWRVMKQAIESWGPAKC